MIVDSSALVALLLDESESTAIASELTRSAVNRISAGSFIETSIVIDGRRNPVVSSRLDALLALHTINIEAVTAEQAVIARQAYRDYGKGSGHAASLNFGDCFSYALAKVTGEPLLYIGDDFGHTDLRSVLPASAT